MNGINTLNLNESNDDISLSEINNDDFDDEILALFNGENSLLEPSSQGEGATPVDVYKRFDGNGFQNFTGNTWEDGKFVIEKYDVVDTNVNLQRVLGRNKWKEIKQEFKRQAMAAKDNSGQSTVTEQACQKYVEHVKSGNFDWDPRSSREPAFWIGRNQGAGRWGPEHKRILGRVDNALLTEYALATKEELFEKIKKCRMESKKKTKTVQEDAKQRPIHAGMTEPLLPQSASQARKRRRAPATEQQHEEDKDEGEGETVRSLFSCCSRFGCGDLFKFFADMIKRNAAQIKEKLPPEVLASVATSLGIQTDPFDPCWNPNERKLAETIQKELLGNNPNCTYWQATEICMLRDPDKFGIHNDERWDVRWDPKIDCTLEEITAKAIDRAEYLILNETPRLQRGKLVKVNAILAMRIIMFEFPRNFGIDAPHWWNVDGCDDKERWIKQKVGKTLIMEGCTLENVYTKLAHEFDVPAGLLPSSVHR